MTQCAERWDDLRGARDGDVTLFTGSSKQNSNLQQFNGLAGEYRSQHVMGSKKAGRNPIYSFGYWSGIVLLKMLGIGLS